MKQIISILGPNAVGKSTTASILLEKCPMSAYIDSDWCRAINPFVFTPSTKRAVTENIYCLLKNYLLCDDIETIIFPHSFHGERKAIFEEVISRLENEQIKFGVHHILLKCSEEENHKRAIADGRDEARILRGMKNTFHYYDEFSYPVIDTTKLKPEQVAEQILKIVEEAGKYQN